MTPPAVLGPNRGEQIGLGPVRIGEPFGRDAMVGQIGFDIGDQREVDSAEVVAERYEARGGGIWCPPSARRSTGLR